MLCARPRGGVHFAYGVRNGSAGDLYMLVCVRTKGIQGGDKCVLVIGQLTEQSRDRLM